MRAAGQVLVIDEDEDMRSRIVGALQARGYDVWGVPSGAMALDLLWQAWDRQPDVILLDMRRPSIDSRRFVEAYRVLPVPQAQIVVMATSGRAEERAATIDVDDVLLKPVDLDDLIERVYRACREQERRAA